MIAAWTKVDRPEYEVGIVDGVVISDFLPIASCLHDINQSLGVIASHHTIFILPTLLVSRLNFDIALILLSPWAFLW